MHLFINANYPFMKWRRFGYTFSIVTLALSIIVLVIKGGPKWSVDFVGGSRTSPHLEIAPLDVGPLLREGVWDRRTAILTSATIPSSLVQRVG